MKKMKKMKGLLSLDSILSSFDSTCVIYFLLVLFWTSSPYSIGLVFSFSFCAVTHILALVVGVVGLGWLGLAIFLDLVTG